MKIIKHSSELKGSISNKKTAYLQYRVGKIKHELWLKSRKSNKVYLTLYDNYIVQMLAQWCKFEIYATGLSVFLLVT